ncbi:MAG: hypothetical protein ABI905_03330 [Betaproteobacteria bacterium]
MPSYKLQVQEDEAKPDAWHDVKSDSGEMLVFTDESAARAKLEELYPVLAKMEKFAAGPKRTRVIVVNPYSDIDKEKED